MKRRFMLYSFLVASIIGSFLLFANTGQAYTIPNASFTQGEDGLDGWNLIRDEGQASVIHYGGGVNSVKLLTGAENLFSLESGYIALTAGETIYGWFKNLTEAKGLNVYIWYMQDGIDQGAWRSTKSFNTWESWNFTAPIKYDYYTIYLQNGNASVGEFAFSPVAPVPIPPTVWLLGSGLVGLVGLRRRFFRK